MDISGGGREEEERQRGCHITFGNYTGKMMM
jgi:hypothetical protein